MLRQILIQFALFLTPFLVYAVILRSRGRPVAVGASWSDAPWGWLVVGGLLVTALGFALLAVVNDGAGQGHYVPARLENGVLVPGRFEP